MDLDFSKYLASHVLAEGEIVSYRSLSRALSVHVNVAKRMLFDFHTTQNRRSPGSVHATYLILGAKRRSSTANEHHEHEAVAQSSPFQSSSFAAEEHEPEPLQRVLMLTEETTFGKAAVASFDTVTSIHIHSLAPSKLQDLQVLSDVSRSVSLIDASNDPMTPSKPFGTIRCNAAQRRSGKVLAPVEASKPATILKDTKSDSSTAQKDLRGKKPGLQPSTVSEQDSLLTSTESVPKPAGKPKAPASLKKEGSDLFAAFAKSKTKAKTPAAPQTSSEQPLSNKEHKSESPFGSNLDNENDGENEAELDTKELTQNLQRQREERAARLQEMMDDNDVDMTDPPKEDPDTAMDDAASEEDPPTDKPIEQNTDPSSQVSTRRRGRRRVMRKITTKDAEGFLVTREEAAWESFSEDEPVAAAPKASKTSSTAGSKPKKSAGKAGNIMSFFAKK